MKKIKVLIGAIILCLVLGYLSIVLNTSVQQVQAENTYTGSAGDYPCGGYGDIKIYAGESPSCASGTDKNMTSYGVNFNMTAETNPWDNRNLKQGDYKVVTAISSNFCKDASGPCYENGGTNGAAPSNYTSYISVSSNGDVSTSDSPINISRSAPYACGSYQYDLSFEVYRKNSSNTYVKICSYDSMTDPANSNAFWASCTTGKACTVPTPTGVTPSPTGVTPSPTGVTPSPTGVTPSPTGVTPSPTVTVTPPPPHLTVYKYVQGDGTKGPGDFTIHVTGTDVQNPQFQGSSTGTPVYLSEGAYSVTEDQLSGYTLTGRSAGCYGHIYDGDNVVCVLINTQNGITPTPTSTNTNNCNNTNQSGNTGGNNNNNCNQQQQNQQQNQYNNNNQTVNISYAAPAQQQQQQQQQVLGVSYPVSANSLPSTGPEASWELIGALAPLGFILRKITQG